MANTNFNTTNASQNNGTQNNGANSANDSLDSLQSNPYINNNAQNQQAQNGFGNAFGVNQTTQANQTNAQGNTTNALSSFFNSGNSQQDFLKGAFIGAVATFILTNKDAQKAIFKGFAKISSLFEMGIEELKERYEDAKAEVDSN